jgi:hypothetical protein
LLTARAGVKVGACTRKELLAKAARCAPDDAVNE